MAEIVIFGYLGFGNLGDETNLRELIKFLRKVEPGSNLTVITGSPETTAKKYRVKAIHRNHFQAIISALRQADFLIGCGGTLFQDQTSRRSLIYYALCVISARIFQTKICLYAQGIGPITSIVGKMLAKFAISQTDLITVRDRLSVIAMMEMNLRRPEINFTAEPLLALKAVPRETVAAYWKGQTDVKFGLILKNHPSSRDLWKELLETIKWERKFQPFLIVIAEDDLAFNLGLSSACGIELVKASDDWERCQSVVGGMQFIFSSRLHGLVAAVTQQIPCCGLSTDPKIDGFCLQWDIPLIPLNQDVDRLILYNRMADLLTNATGASQHLPPVEFYRARALENQMVLQKFLKR